MTQFKNLKSLLTESNMATALDVRKFGLSDILEAYKNNGYIISREEMKYFMDSKYHGFKDGAHSFIVMMEDDNQGGFYLTKFFITLGKEGNLVAESSGAPFFEDEDEDVVTQRFFAS